MPIVIEALTLVVPRSTLEKQWPGGVADFFEFSRSVKGARFAIADSALVGVGFFDPEDSVPLGDRLETWGIHPFADADADDAPRAGGFVIVDQRLGPLVPCDWLRWWREPEGHTTAWSVETETSELVAPPNWTPKRSRELVRTDDRDDRERLFALGSTQDVEHWLEFDSGNIVSSPVVLSPLEQRAAQDARRATLLRVQSALRAAQAERIVFHGETSCLSVLDGYTIHLFFRWPDSGEPLLFVETVTYIALETDPGSESTLTWRYVEDDPFSGRVMLAVRDGQAVARHAGMLSCDRWFERNLRWMLSYFVEEIDGVKEWLDDAAN